MPAIFLIFGVTNQSSKSRKTALHSSPATSRRLSCIAVRSPTIPQEIRRSGKLPGYSPEYSPEMKRQKLVSALEQCDEDLRTLKSIIDGLRLAERRRGFDGTILSSPEHGLSFRN